MSIEPFMQHLDRLQISTGLDTHDRPAIDRLLDLCNRAEGLALPFFLDSASQSETPTDFVVRAPEELVGFAWLPDDPAPEGCLMVHPAHRRQGIGRALLAALQTEGRRRGLSELLLVADQAATSGRAFLEAVGARYQSSEYRMALDSAAIDRSRPGIPDLHLRPAGMDELAILTRLRSAGFGGDEGKQREDLIRRLREPNRRHFLAELAGEPIGMISVIQVGREVDVTSFAVLPERQGHGYGRQILLETVDLLLGEGHEQIRIEVATENERALGLYRSCGFAVAAAYGYYEIETYAMRGEGRTA